MKFFDLDSGVLSQYGRPATQEIYSDPFSSAVKGFVVGQDIANKKREQDRADERVKLEERRVSETERHNIEQEAAAREDRELRRDAEERQLRAEQRQIETHRRNLRNLDAQYRNYIRDENDAVKSKQGAEIVLNAREAVLADPEMAGASEDEINAKVYDVLKADPDGKYHALSASQRSALHSAKMKSALNDPAQQQKLLVDGVNQLQFDPGGALLFFKDLAESRGYNPELLKKVEYLPPDDTREGMSGYVLRTFIDGVTPEGATKKESIANLMRNNPAYADQLQRDLQAWQTHKKRQNQELTIKVREAFFYADKQYERLVAQSKAAVKTPDDDKIDEVLTWVQSQDPLFLDNYPNATEQWAYATRVAKWENYFSEAGEGKTPAEYRQEAYDVVRGVQTRARQGEDAINEFLYRYTGGAVGQPRRGVDAVPAGENRREPAIPKVDIPELEGEAEVPASAGSKAWYDQAQDDLRTGAREKQKAQLADVLRMYSQGEIEDSGTVEQNGIKENGVKIKGKWYSKEDLDALLRE